MKNPIFLFITVALSISAHAQTSVGPSVLNSVGGGGIINANTYDYSIGEMTLVGTVATANLIVTQGLLQPVTATTGIPATNALAGKLSVYPNPSTDVIYLQPTMLQGARLQYKLFDMLGQFITQADVYLSFGTEKQTLHVSGLAAGDYMLYVTIDLAGTQYSNSYKIQKLH